MVASDLPQETLIDIFSRLPAKFVGQCRCLSKPWRQILSSPHFIKAHLNRINHQQSLLLIDNSRSCRSIATFKDGAISRELELPFGCTEILGSCDGLVLLVNGEGNKLLVNPLTLDKVKIPNSPLALQGDEEETVSMYGFGYDSSIDDYKIVTLSYYKVGVDDDDEDEDEDVQEPDCDETFVDVYLVKRGVWKRLDSCSPYNHDFHEPHSGTFLNGAIHWLASRKSSYRSVLIAFHLFDEVFTEIPTPRDMKMENCVFFQPVVLGGCLCMIDVQYGYQANVWMMKEYGSVESWTKVSIDTCGKWGIERPLCFVWDREIVSAAEGRLLGVYNVKEGNLRDIIVDGVLAVLEDGVIFVPSLVSPANVDRASPPDVAYHEASTNLALALKNNLILVQHLKHYRTIVGALEQEDKPELESEMLRKSRVELSELTRDHKKMQGVIRRLSEKLGETFMLSDRGKPLIDEMGRHGTEAYKVSSKFQLDLYNDVVLSCRRLLRESGLVNEDVVMLVGPDVPDSC